MDPSLKDNRCPDVMTAHSLLKHCMSNHQFGLSALLASREAALRTRNALNEALRHGAAAPPSAEAAQGGESVAAQEAAPGAPQQLAHVGAWEALPILVQRTYLLDPADYAQVPRPTARAAPSSSATRARAELSGA